MLIILVIMQTKTIPKGFNSTKAHKPFRFMMLSKFITRWQGL